jgi:site-specific recombinase XerD
VTFPAQVTIARTLDLYQDWLTHQPLSAHTRRTYLGRVRQYCAYLAATPAEYGDPLCQSHARDYAVRDYKALLKTAHHAKPTSVNLTLSALDHFYQFLGLERPNVTREDLPQQAPKALEPEEQKQFLRAVERRTSLRDRALAILLFYTGLRLQECADLTVDDVRLSARKGVVIVRSGKGETYREVPLNAQTREALSAWMRERRRAFPESRESAFFLSRQGRRLSTRAIDLVIRQLGEAARLTLSTHTLRHTCLTTLVRQGTDLVLVAEIAGHRRLETTRRYSLPTARDREAAMERLQVEY